MSTIDTEVFVKKMEERWTGKLGNVSNEPLKETWEQIARTLNRHINCHDDSELSKEWSVLQPPTGSGKTQSVILYSAMMAEEENHPGILIVTRLIADCDGIVEQINGIAEKPDYAIAYHSEANVKADALKDYPVVVITHKAYENALDYLGDDASIRRTWPFFHDWQMGTRKLVVIDEGIDIVESNQAGLDGLRETLGAIPQKIRDEHPSDIGLVQGIINTLEAINVKSKEYDKPVKDLMAVNTGSKALEFDKDTTDITGLINALKDIKFDPQDPLKNEQLRQKHAKRLKSLQYVLRSWCYYSAQNNGHMLHTARLLIPEDVKGAVVLDATASSNIIYELHKDSQTINVPSGTRNYQNVTLHVSKGNKVGKTWMVQNATKVSGELISELTPMITEGETLVVCHKNIEAHLKKYETSFVMKTGHWGAIDGSNEWKDCSNVVIFGLPYRPEYWTADAFMALQNPTDTEWLRDSDKRSFGKHADIRKAIMNGQIVTDVIQAINRVRCRKTIDSEGNCEETHVYILLPKDALAYELVGGIRKQMPGIKVTEWDYTGQKKKPKASKHEQSLVKYIENMESDNRYAMGHVGKSLGISPATMGRLKAKTKDPDSDVRKAMDQNGVTVESVKSGRTNKDYLVKNENR